MLDFRQKADYDFDADITPEAASELIKKSQEFYQLSKAYLQKLVPESDN